MEKECEVLEPMWHQGKQVKAGDVISLSIAEAASLSGIGRVAYVESGAAAADDPHTDPDDATPAKKKRKADAD